MSNINFEKICAGDAGILRLLSENLVFAGHFLHRDRSSGFRWLRALVIGATIEDGDVRPHIINLPSVPPLLGYNLLLAETYDGRLYDIENPEPLATGTTVAQARGAIEGWIEQQDAEVRRWRQARFN